MTEVFSVSTNVSVPFARIYLDDHNAEHIRLGHRDIAQFILTGVKEVVENPTRLHGSSTEYNRLLFVSENVVSSSGKRVMMVVVERDQDAGKVITATWKGSVSGPVFWDSETNVFAHYDADNDVMYVSRGTVREAYADDDPAEPSIWLRRADEDDAPVGVTIFGFAARWSSRVPELAHRIAEFLTIAPGEVERRLKAAA